MITSLLIKRK